MSALILSKPIRVQPGPANYYSYPGAIDELERFYDQERLSRAFILSGKRAGTAAEPYLPKALGEAFRLRRLFAGHCSHETVDELAAKAPQNTSIVIGVGGGSALDTAKALAVKIDKPFAAIPTIAATCAATTPLSVWYSESGKALGYEIFPRAADVVLVEPRIILDAPAEFLQAGLADTLAKWYEADILCSTETRVPLTARLGLEISRILNEVLLEKGETAFRSMSEKRLTEDFTEIVDAVLIGGASVGGLGERYTRIAAAHSVHNGLSALPESGKYLHGTKVAYGILVQAALLGNEKELALLIGKFRSLGLPTKLADLGIDFNNKTSIDTIISSAIAPHESIHLLPFTIDAARLEKAVALVETVSQGKGEY